MSIIQNIRDLHDKWLSGEWHEWHHDREELGIAMADAAPALLRLWEAAKAVDRHDIKHDDTCPLWANPMLACSCGVWEAEGELEEALAALTKEQP